MHLQMHDEFQVIKWEIYKLLSVLSIRELISNAELIRSIERIHQILIRVSA